MNLKMRGEERETKKKRLLPLEGPGQSRKENIAIFHEARMMEPKKRALEACFIPLRCPEG